MKDELTKDQWLAKQSQEFKVIRYCKECGSKVTKSFPTNALICTICRAVELYETVYQCSLCLEEHEDEECNCYG